VTAFRHRCASLARPGLLAVVALAAGILISPAPASAQNFFDLLFGGFRRSAPPPPPPSYPDPLFDQGDPRDGYPRADYGGGPSVAYCVRTCDGRFFPIRAGNPAEICESFCPAAQTRIFSGSKIDHAVSHDGRSYRELPNAFLYREKLVDGCTCNGKDPFGLARIDVREDPTLRPGDIVATGKGLMQTSARRDGELAFTPISGDLRKRLSDIKVAPAHDSEAGDTIPGYEGFKQSQAAQGLRPQISR